MKLTVSEYAAEFKTSVQSVYQRIKRGTLKSIEENGVKYVIVEEKSVKDNLNTDFKVVLKRAFKTIEYLEKENRAQRKEIKRLTKSVEEARSEENKTLKEVFNELKELKLIGAPVPEARTEEVTEAEIVKDKKKSKKDKKKKK